MLLNVAVCLGTMIYFTGLDCASGQNEAGPPGPFSAEGPNTRVSVKCHAMQPTILEETSVVEDRTR
jgi:hypothetical protein